MVLVEVSRDHLLAAQKSVFTPALGMRQAILCPETDFCYQA